MFGFHGFGPGFGPGFGGPGGFGPGGFGGPALDAKSFKAVAALKTEALQLRGAAARLVWSGDAEKIEKVAETLHKARTELFSLITDEA